MTPFDVVVYVQLPLQFTKEDLDAVFTNLDIPSNAVVTKSTLVGGSMTVTWVVPIGVG